MKKRLIITALFSAGLAAQAQTILIDTFDMPTGTAQEFNLQSNQVVRQAGSAVSVTYTNVSATIIAATQEYLTQTEAYETNGVLNLRGLCNGEGSPSIAAASVAINEDLASSLAGKHYQISYTGVMIDRIGNISTNSSSLDRWYQGISLGGAAGLPLDPMNAATDTGFQMRSDGIAEIWGDGNLLSAVAVSNFTLLQPYTVFIDINESNSTVKATVACAGVFTDLPLAPITFEAGETSRRIQLMNRLSVVDFNDPADWDAWADAQFNDLQIDLITAPAVEDYVVSDSYLVPAGTAQEFDLETYQAYRQIGSTINVTYTNVGAGIAGAHQEYLTQTEAYDGSGVLNLRGLIDAVGQNQIAAPAVAFNEDLSPWLSDEKYSISFSGIMIARAGGTATNSTYIESWYQSFSISGTGFPGAPTLATADLGFRMRYMGIAEIWGDGYKLSAVGVSNFAVATPYTVTININETDGTGTASVEVGGVVTELPSPFPINFEAGETNRNFHFMNRVFSYDTHPQNPGWDVWVDAQINDLKVSIIRDKSYETWVLVDTGLTGGVNDARTDDPDLDGMDNLLEYVLGGNPLIDDAASILPKYSLPDNTAVECVYRRRTDADERGLVYDVYLTTDLLSSWDNVSNSLETATGTINADFESVTNELDITGISQGFLNLRVTEE